MAMAIGSPDGEEDAVIASINTTPLVDVMLVLLIIFLITSPVVIKTIPIKLPAEHNQPYKTKPENITPPKPFPAPSKPALRLSSRTW